MDIEEANQLTLNKMDIEEINHLTHKNAFKLLYSGLISGLIQAMLFNPWDKALYLSVKYDRPFINVENFKKPFDGVFQTMTQRAISAGLYFPLEDIFKDFLNYSHDNTATQRSIKSFLAGTFAGAMNGFLMNPLASIKVSSSYLEQIVQIFF